MSLVVPFAFTLFVWWFSTGLILLLDGLPKKTYRWSLLGATGLLAAALYGFAASADSATVSGAYTAFSCAVIVWGWQEMAFLMGFVTGPRPLPCPDGATGWRRFRYAFEALAYNELALVGFGLLIALLTWNAANRVGLWTFVVLWTMRQSAKLNLFLGVRNLYEDFLPDSLRYLQSYYRRKTINLLFPFSVSISTLCAFLVWQRALAFDASPFDATQYALVGTLLVLAILEHWFLVLPFSVRELWEWSLRVRSGSATAGSTESTLVRGIAGKK